MNTEQITELAIKRHDIDANHFQDTYSKKDTNFSKHQRVFLNGRALVLEELELLLDKVPKGSKVLDVGCGTAHLTNWIKQKGFEVYGIEPSNEMYTFAKENFPEIEIKKGISSAIPYPDNSFDLIVSFEVLRYIDRAENIKTYKEFYRVLKSGGSFFVTQVNLFSTDWYYFFHQTKALYSKLFNKTHHHCNFTTAQQEERQVKEAGFKEVFTVGRFLGSNRIAYKFGSAIGDAYYAITKAISKHQRYTNPVSKNLTAHLIVEGKK